MRRRSKQMPPTKIETGTEVTRMVAGTIPSKLLVTKIEDGLIYCGPWKFCAETGAEVDEELDWGPPPLATGSFLQEVVKGPN
jgi:hypothetical protein